MKGMITMLKFIVGLVLGSIFGVFTMGILIASRSDDNER